MMHRGGHQSSWGRPHRGGGSGGQGYGGGGRDVAGPSESGQTGHLLCGHDLSTHTCAWRSHSEVAMKLHRADRHLVYPPGGLVELEMIDPLLEEERKERAKRIRRGKADQADEGQQQMSLITGLNITLSTPELIQQWVAERKKRWPSNAVVEKKQRESWDNKVEYKGKGRAMQAQSRNSTQMQPQRPASKVEKTTPVVHEAAAAAAAAMSSSTSSSSSSSSDDDDDSSGSDMDEEKDAISSKVPPASLPVEEEQRVLCRFFQQGRCSFGDKCRDRHEAATAAPTRVIPVKKRKRPRPPSPNPFEAPHLLRALLRNEIAQHVNYIAQVVRFLVRNDYLQGFEEEAGQAEAQARTRKLVVEETVAEGSQSEALDLGSPLVDGGLPTLGNTIIEPAPVPLKSVKSIALPPEPDPLAFMDPLRANDPKPLMHSQYHRIALDGGIRSCILDDKGKISASMERALTTLDSLPSYAHRSSAIELILGVSEQSQQHPHQVGSTFVRNDRSAADSRVIGEAELFRCGLRVGPQEIGKLRQLAARVSNVVGGPSFEVDAGDQEEEDAMRPWWDKDTRDEIRRKKWSKEADWRDQMRKLGLEVD
jgi:hypothetical protein